MQSHPRSHLLGLCLSVHREWRREEGFRVEHTQGTVRRPDAPAHTGIKNATFVGASQSHSQGHHDERGKGSGSRREAKSITGSSVTSAAASVAPPAPMSLLASSVYALSSTSAAAASTGISPTAAASITTPTNAAGGHGHAHVSRNGHNRGVFGYDSYKRIFAIEFLLLCL
jgi:hypothetical protein